MNAHLANERLEGRRRLAEVVAWLDATHPGRGWFPERPQVRMIRGGFGATAN